MGLANQPESESVLSESVLIRKKYGKVFPGTSLHHPIPTSRIPKTWPKEEKAVIELMTFPYDRKAHGAYHPLLWNLRIDQVWNLRLQIHFSIFEIDADYTKEWWKEYCELESGIEKQRRAFEKEKRERLAKSIETKQLRSLWKRTFGGEDLATAENLLEIMMLFMVFGTEILNKDTLFNNGNLSNFFEKNQAKGYKFWASQVLFGEGGSDQGKRSKIVSILNKNRYYSSKIL